MPWLKGKSRGLRATCRKGHAMTPDNVWTRPSDGARYCRLCQSATPSRQKNLTSQSPTCRNGHVRTPLNTLIGVNGRKYCTTCVSEAHRQARRSQHTTSNPEDTDIPRLIEEQDKGWEEQLKAYIEKQSKPI